jgi:hypothetical protein
MFCTPCQTASIRINKSRRISLARYVVCTKEEAYRVLVAWREEQRSLRILWRKCDNIKTNRKKIRHTDQTRFFSFRTGISVLWTWLRIFRIHKYSQKVLSNNFQSPAQEMSCPNILLVLLAFIWSILKYSMTHPSTYFQIHHSNEHPAMSDLRFKRRWPPALLAFAVWRRVVCWHVPPFWRKTDYASNTSPVYATHSIQQNKQSNATINPKTDRSNLRAYRTTPQDECTFTRNYYNTVMLG